MVKKFLPTYLLGLSFFIAEIHTFWHNDETVVNWIWQTPHPMLIKWNIWYASQQINGILLGLSLYLIALYPNRVNRTSAIVYLLWAIWDTCTYFVNYKQGTQYGLMYFYLAAAWLLCFYGKRVARVIWNNLHPHET